MTPAIRRGSNCPAAQALDQATIELPAAGHGLQTELRIETRQRNAAVARLDEQQLPGDPHRRTAAEQNLGQGQRPAIVVG